MKIALLCVFLLPGDKAIATDDVDESNPSQELQGEAAEDGSQAVPTALEKLLETLEYRGNVSLELTGFLASADHVADQSFSSSLSGEVELYFPLSSGNSSIVVTPFARLDQHDPERTHFDFREFLYQRNSDNWEFRIGLGKIFWGVAESRNPVDIINQRDAVEGFTVDEKLGQPLLQFSWFKDLGSIDFFVLPGFREQTFAGVDGRPRLSTPISQNALYESDSEYRHIDFALRYSTAIEEWDLGFSAFRGTARDPLLLPIFGTSFTDASLQPFYYQISQIGFDAQATLESWLLKFEWIHQQADVIANHTESVIGFEYSFFGVAESDADLGVIAEYLHDNRGEASTQPFQNDLLVGFRLALNDEASTEALVGSFIDLDTDAIIVTFEANRRIGNSFKVSLEAVSYLNTENDPGLNQLRNEDYLQAEIAWFF